MNPPNETPSASQRTIVRHHSAQGRRYAKAVGFIALFVLTGVVIGVGCSVLYFNKKLHRVPARPDAIAEAMIKRMHELLGLSADEEARLRNIVNTRMREVEAIRKQSFEEIHEVFDKMSGEVAGIIGPERDKIWQDYKDKRFGEKRRERQAKRMGKNREPKPRDHQ